MMQTCNHSYARNNSTVNDTNKNTATTNNNAPSASTANDFTAKLTAGGNNNGLSQILNIVFKLLQLLSDDLKTNRGTNDSKTGTGATGDNASTPMNNAINSNNTAATANVCADGTVGTGGANSPPAMRIGSDFDAGTPENTPITFDGALNNNTLSVSNLTQPANGTVTLDGNNLTYTPNVDFNGLDVFRYTVTDENGESSTSTALINVGEQPGTTSTGPGLTGIAGGTPNTQDANISIRVGDFTGSNGPDV